MKVAGSDVQVEYGTDGWLFLAGFGGLRYLDPASDLTEWRRRLLPRLTDNFAARHARVTERGIPFFVLIAPEASGIYSESLPEGRTIDIPTAGECLAAELIRKGVTAICPSPQLRKAKGAVDLYCRLDSHWSYSGAYIAYRELMEKVRKKLPVPIISWQSVWFTNSTNYGDLGVHARPERKGAFQNIEITGYDVEADPNVFDLRDKNIRRFTCAQGVGRALIFRDSFTNALSPFFERTFAETILVAPASHMVDDAIDKYKPDIVILEVAERGLFGDDGPFNDWAARTFDQDYLEIATYGDTGKLQVEATKQLFAGDLTKAAGLAATAIALDDGPARVHNLAWALHKAEALDLVQALAHRYAGATQDRFLYYLSADSYFRQGKIAASSAEISHALTIQPNNALFLWLKAECLFRLGLFYEAMETVCKSIRYAPTHIRSWHLIAEIHDASGNPSEAEKVRRDILERYPD